MRVPRTTSEITSAWLGAMLGGTSAITSSGLRIERIGADRGATGELARCRVHSEDLVVKLPHATAPERAWREVTVYRTLADDLPFPLPRLRAAERDGDITALIFEYAEGEDADALTRPNPRILDALLDGLGTMHGRFWGAADPRLAPLPHWGRGTIDSSTPHARRARRFRRRTTPFLALVNEATAPGLADALARIGETIEADFADVSALEPTLIHADPHLDNVRCGPDDAIMLLDWQSASRGPGLYDAVRLITETCPISDGLPAFERWAHAACAAGAPAPQVERWPQVVSAMVRVIVAGFVSGYGGRSPDALSPRERALIERGAGADGLAAWAVAVAESGAAPPF